MGSKAAPPLPGHHPSPAMAAPAPTRAGTTADDPFRPIDISSDEDEDVIILGSSNSREEMQIQQVTLLSLDPSHDPTTIPSSSGTAVTGTSEVSIPDRKGRRKPRSELALFPVASSRSLSKPKKSQVIDLDGDSLPPVIDLDDDDCSLIFHKDLGTSKMKLFDCTICMETVPGVRRFPIAGCTHAFCVSCVRQYIEAKVEENVLAIGCPDPGCKDGTLQPEACRDVIPLLLFQRWGAALCEMALGELKFYCPFKDCSALLVDDHQDGDAAITDVECPHCSRVFCAQCKVPWHDGVDCAEFQRLGDDERGREDLLLRKFAQESKWRRCSKCKVYVERVEGCVYIVCRCGHRFCYLCGSAMVKGNHHCSKCKRTW